MTNMYDVRDETCCNDVECLCDVYWIMHWMHTVHCSMVFKRINVVCFNFW